MTVSKEDRLQKVASLALSPETKTGSSQSQPGCAPKSATSGVQPSGAGEP